MSPDDDKNITENSDLNNIAEEFFGNSNYNIQGLYLLILIFLILAGTLMAIIKVPVFIESRGTLRPGSDKKQLCVQVQGVIKKIYVEENQKINNNDLIMIIDTDKEKVQIEYHKREISSINRWIKDCRYLTLSQELIIDSLFTPKYQSEFRAFTHEQKILDMEIKQNMIDINRMKPMEADSLISKKEMEEKELKYSNLVERYISNLSLKRNLWQGQFDDFKQKQISLEMEIYMLEQQIKNSELRSPSSGIIQGIRNVFVGDYCPVGKPICYLIPDNGMVIEMFVPSKDIGFVKPGLKSRFKIDAFDYKYWGFLEGECISVSKDFEIVENIPFFRVICKPDQPTQLNYKDKTVFLSPGMTLTTQFLFTSRNLWQMIRDKTVDMIEE